MSGLPGFDSPSVEEDPRHAALRLSLVPGVGPRIHMALLERFGSAQAALSAPAHELRATPGVGSTLSRQIAAARHQDISGELALCRERQITLLTSGDPGYPPLLKEICDPPQVLFVRGGLLERDNAAIAIVGSRHATRYGLDQAQRLAAGLARAGLTVVSGLARGIDGAAHRGALEAGGRTLAVLGSGVLNIYPPEHEKLADEVLAHGAILSEAPPLSPPRSGAFPQRNRIVSGLCLGVIIVEAALRSGALITARHAMEQGREVFAVPGRIDSRMSHGCHRLIRDGAKLIESVDDVLEELGPLAVAAPQEDGRTLRNPAELQLNDIERQVLDAVSLEPMSIDQVIAASGLAAPQVLATLSALEMRRLIRRHSGSLVARK